MRMQRQRRGSQKLLLGLPRCVKTGPPTEVPRALEWPLNFLLNNYRGSYLLTWWLLPSSGV